MSFSTPGNISIERKSDVFLENVDPTSVDKIDFIYDVKSTVNWIKESKFAKVCLQLPDHLLKDSVNICQRLKCLTQKHIYILADTTYNSCCVDEVAAKHINAEAIVHYGHSCLSPSTFPVFHVYPKAPLNLSNTIKTLNNILTKSLKNIIFFDISLQYMSDDICKDIFTHFPSTIIGVFSQEQTGTIFNKSLINSNKEIQPIDILKDYNLIFLGAEGPTLFNLAVCSNAKEIYLMDINKYSIVPYCQSTWFKRRRFLVEKCKDATNIGILVCTLSITNFNSIIRRLKDIIKVNGKKSYVLSVGKPNIAKLSNISEIEIFVLIACPENDLYSSRDFLQPIVYPYELELALNNLRDPYDPSYSTDFNELLPNGKNHCDIVENSIDQPDVSLITGNVRNISIKLEETECPKDDITDLVRKEDWAVSELGIGKAITSRSWKGLEQNLGATSVDKAQIGRRGIASGYENENQ